MDLQQLFGPGYAGYLYGRDSAKANEMQALQGMGMLSQMQRQAEQNKLLEQQIKMAQLKTQKEVELQDMLKPFLTGAMGGSSAPAQTAATGVNGFLNTTPMDMGPGAEPQPAPQPQQSAPMPQMGFGDMVRNPGFLGITKLLGQDLTGVGTLAQKQFEHGNMSADQKSQATDRDRRFEIDRTSKSIESSARGMQTARIGNAEYQYDPVELAGWRRTPGNEWRSVQDFLREKMNQSAPAGNESQAPGSAVSRVPTPAEQAADRVSAEGRAKFWTDTMSNLSTAAMTAPSQLAQLSILGEALKNAGSGPMTQAIIKSSDFLRQLGLDTESLKRVPAAQQAEMISNRMTLALRGAGDNGVVGMPGAMSDSDREFLRAAIPNLKNNPQSNAAMIEILTRIERRKQEVAKLAANYAKAYGNGKLDEGFLDALKQFSNKNPLFARGQL